MHIFIFPLTKKKIYSNYHYQKVSIKSNQFNISTTFIQQMSIYTSKSYTSNNFTPIITFDQKSFSSKLFPHAYLFPSKWNNSGIKRWTKKIFDRYSKTFCRNEISRHQDDSERSERRDTGWQETPFFYDTLKRARRERDCGKAYLKVIPKGSRCKLRGTCGRHVERWNTGRSPQLPPQAETLSFSRHKAGTLVGSLSGSWDRRKEGQSGKESWKLCSIRPDRTKWNFNREEILTRWETCTIMERSLIDARFEWYGLRFGLEIYSENIYETFPSLKDLKFSAILSVLIYNFILSFL